MPGLFRARARNSDGALLQAIETWFRSALDRSEHVEHPELIEREQVNRWVREAFAEVFAPGYIFPGPRLSRRPAAGHAAD